jgi:hypothetical protein
MAARLRKIEANLNAYNSRITTFLEDVVYDHPDKEIEDLCYSSLSSPDSVITFDTEFPDNVIERIKSKIEIVKNQLSCLKTTKYRMDVIEKVQKHLEKMSKEIKNFTSSLPQVNGGRRRRRRKSRKKKGRGSCMSRKKKHISARQPKEKYVIEAIQILEQDQTYLNAEIPEKARRSRNLALELQDNDKKGGRKKRKSRRRTKKKRKSRRRKTKRRRR